MKRIFTFFFALLSACTFSAYAAIVDGTCGDNLTWTLNTKDSTLVISGRGEMKNYNYYSAPWFDYRSYIKYATIQDSVTSIGNSAFYECSGLTSVTIGNSVTSIGEDAFAHCDGLTSVTLGNSVTSIGYMAFVSCDGLTSITIPNSVTSIGYKAFSYCSGLTSITIPNSVIEIGSAMFYGCKSLKSVVLSENMTSLPQSDMGEGFFEDCASLTSITIPNSVTSIGSNAFRNCSGLISVTIGSGVTSIEGGAFSGCRILISVTIPESVTSIGGYAFENCSRLTSITIPNSVTSIGGYAFRDCSGLTSVTLGNSVTSIGYRAFYSCNKIQEVTAYMPTPLDAKDCGINPAAATLYVPAESLDIYSNTLWWEDFKEIRAIDADYVVTFFDWDDTVLARVAVAAGEAATAPEAPVREGYTFIGWDKDFSCVIEDMTVTAQYQINRYQVRFYDWDDTLLKTDSVDYQAAATAPADPVREGYTFIGWDKDFSSITADLDVYAQYEAGADKEFEVIFSDQDNNELSAQSVTLRVPLAPEIEGFTFLYWKTIDARVDDVITLQAVYESNTPSAAPEVFVNPANPAQKLIRNGQVYILHEDKMYTISGQVVK